MSSQSPQSQSSLTSQSSPPKKRKRLMSFTSPSQSSSTSQSSPSKRKRLRSSTSPSQSSSTSQSSPTKLSQRSRVKELEEEMDSPISNYKDIIDEICKAMKCLNVTDSDLVDYCKEEELQLCAICEEPLYGYSKKWDVGAPLYLRGFDICCSHYKDLCLLYHNGITVKWPKSTWKYMEYSALSKPQDFVPFTNTDIPNIRRAIEQSTSWEPYFKLTPLEEKLYLPKNLKPWPINQAYVYIVQLFRSSDPTNLPSPKAYKKQSHRIRDFVYYELQTPGPWDNSSHSNDTNKGNLWPGSIYEMIVNACFIRSPYDRIFGYDRPLPKDSNIHHCSTLLQTIINFRIASETQPEACLILFTTMPANGFLHPHNLKHLARLINFYQYLKLGHIPLLYQSSCLCRRTREALSNLSV